MITLSDAILAINPDAEFDYRPDLYLPIADLWWEHFGIDKKGESPFGKKYIKEYQNKKNLHERLHTNHFFTYMISK